MPTKIVYLSGEFAEYLRDMCIGMYLDGQCYEFAIALHNGLGWPMVGIRANYLGKDTVRHAVVRHPNGNFFDARGEVTTEEELVAPFGLDRYYLVNVTEGDLRAVRLVESYNIETSRRIAEARFPLLPWSISQRARYKEFADGLEALSLKTGVWIRGSVPASAPVLADSGGDEEGYTLRQTAEGLGYTINRRFVNDVFDSQDAQNAQDEQ